VTTVPPAGDEQVSPFAGMDGQQAEPERKRYRSPEGTYECIRKTAMEDASLTDAEFRVLLHLAGKPERNRDGEPWRVCPKAIAADLRGGSRWSEDKVEKALAGLNRKGYVPAEAERDRHGRITGWSRTLERGRVLYSQDESAQVSTRSQNSRAWKNAVYSDYGPSNDYGSVLLKRLRLGPPSSAVLAARS
jgi:DNA-binding MarR family transcriptional regulator